MTNKASLGRDLISALKETPDTGPNKFRLKVSNFDEYFIRPIPSKNEFINIDDIKHLTDWRNKYPNAFLTEFKATYSQTHSWITEQIHFDNTRMLFMVEDRNQKALAYLGIGYIDWENSYFEADSIVSGGDSPKYLMQNALKVLINWTINQLGLVNVGVRVLSDNSALYFYKKLGFVEIKRVALRKHTELGVTRWVEDPTLKDASRYLVHHYLDNPI